MANILETVSNKLFTGIINIFNNISFNCGSKHSFNEKSALVQII